MNRKKLAFSLPGFKEFPLVPSPDKQKISDFGLFRIIATEYESPTPEGSGEPLGVQWSVWLTSVWLTARKHTDKPQPPRFAIGYGEVQPWVKPHHLTIEILDYEERPIYPPCTSETGLINFTPPIKLGIFPTNVTQLPRLKITNHAPYTYRHKETIETPAAGSVSLLITDRHEFIEARYSFQLGRKGQATIFPPAALSPRAYSAELMNTAYGAITSMIWTPKPYGPRRQTRLYGKPEWFKWTS